MTDVFNVSIREADGSRAAQRVRRAGNTPGVLYGHGKDNVHLSIPSSEVDSAIRVGTKLVTLDGDVTDEIAVIKDVQWDPMGMEVLHLDLNRVRADERLTTKVTVELVGEAPGTKTGGVVKHVLHQLEIDCPVIAIPDKITISVNSLELLDQIVAGDLEFAEGVNLLTPPDSLIVQCVEAADEDDEEAGVADLAAEPEVIGRKAEDEDADG